MLKLFFPLGCLILLLFTSCQHSAKYQAVINGAFTDASGIELILEEMDTRDIHPVDSVIPGRDGAFNFTPVVKEPGFWLLKVRSGKILVLFLNPGDKVELSGSILDFPGKVILNGSEETMLLNNFYRQTRLNELKVDSLEMLLVERQDSAGYYELTQRLDTAFQEIWASQRADEMAFIDNHPNSLASLVVLNYAFGLNPVLGVEDDLAYYCKLDSALFTRFPENKHVKFHHQRVLEYKRKAATGK
ncbi:MAG: DUF4369 domain-containing protein [Bacteroidetes bacterium]|nr:DUF4369 domain-containing protein [Bacteroidota bacterium]